MQQWLGLDPLAAFALRRVEARGWHVSAHFVNDAVEIHAVRGDPQECHIARCEDGTEPRHQFRAANCSPKPQGWLTWSGTSRNEAVRTAARSRL